MYDQGGSIELENFDGKKVVGFHKEKERLRKHGKMIFTNWEKAWNWTTLRCLYFIAERMLWLTLLVSWSKSSMLFNFFCYTYYIDAYIYSNKTFILIVTGCRACGRVKLPHFFCCSGDRGNGHERDGSTSWDWSCCGIEHPTVVDS